MIERLQQPSDSGQRSARRRMRRSRAGGLWGARSIPGIASVDAGPESGPTILGFPAEVPEGTDPGALLVVDDGSDVVAVHRRPVLVKRVDRFGCGALVLAGVAANVSLLLSWSSGDGPTGLTLVRHSVEAARSGVGGSPFDGVWQPFVVVLSGGVLLLFGLLLLIPARSHRLVGVLALIVALAAAAAVLLLLGGAGWTPDGFGPGMSAAVAVAVLGALGALKAMVTAPRVAVVPAEQFPDPGEHPA
jgi:hypothetical protein